MDGRARVARRTVYDSSFSGTQSIEFKFNLEDHLGTSSCTLDDNGAVHSYEEYFPFGETSFGSFAKKRYRYCGKERDAASPPWREESGLYYYGARYYAAWTCRFVNLDPLAGSLVHLSPFCYAGNSPVTLTDVDGLAPGGPGGGGPALERQSGGGQAPGGPGGGQASGGPEGGGGQTPGGSGSGEQAIEGGECPPFDLPTYSHIPNGKYEGEPYVTGKTMVLPNGGEINPFRLVWHNGSNLYNPGWVSEDDYYPLILTAIVYNSNPDESSAKFVPWLNSNIRYDVPSDPDAFGFNLTDGYSDIFTKAALDAKNFLSHPESRSQGLTYVALESIAIDAVTGIRIIKSVYSGARIALSKLPQTAARSTLTKSQLKAISSFEKQIAKHKAKLAEYIKDPMKFDNKGFLKNAPNEAIKQNIINARINHLLKEIKTFQDNIQKIINGN